MKFNSKTGNSMGTFLANKENEEQSMAELGYI